MTSGDLHSLSGAYAVDALDDLERRLFERHLATCATCREEVDGLLATAARLAAATETAPPATLKAAVLSAVSRTRQLPPNRLGRTSPAWRWVSGLTAVAAAVAILTLSVFAIGEHGRADRVQRAAERVSAVVQAPDAKALQGNATGGGVLTMVYAGSRSAAVVTMAGMPALGSDRSYQLWVMRDGGARSVGVVNGSGQIYVTDVRPADTIGLTIEPSGGSKAPTTTPIATMGV